MNTMITKPWGSETLIECNQGYAVKILRVKKDCRLSLQYHNRKHETMYVLKGKALIELNGVCLTKNVGQSVVVIPRTVHRVTALSPSVWEWIKRLFSFWKWIKRLSGFDDLVILEASTPELDDIVRLEDDYGRCTN